jgi:hypothetical protein
VNAGDFKGLRKLAEACGYNFKLGVVLYVGGRPVPFGDRLVAAPMSCCGRDSIFAVFGAQWMQVLRSVIGIPRSNDGLDFHPIYGLHKEPTSEKSHWIDNAVL